MLVSHIWLKEWIDHDLSPEELCKGLTSLGLEASIIKDGRGEFGKIVVGHVESIKKHPNADKLRLVTVDIGNKNQEIVCGAANVSEGQKVPVALLGATLSGDLKIEKREIRGVASEGMICSESELGISEESQGILVLDGDCKTGKPITDYLELEDSVLEIDLTPNRGDCLGFIGIAREVAALTGCKVTPPEITTNTDSNDIKDFKVKIKNENDCPRYTAREISGVKVAPSPLKIRRRLSAVGVRPINNVVDITNYVMMETGHPLHAFDRRDLGGATLIIRSANEGEKFATLDGRKHELSKNMLVIADAEKAVALGGVMGGLNSEVKGDTTELILEAARFDPVSIRRTSKKLGISTESSHRFERGVDLEAVAFASHRAAQLMVEHAGGKAVGFVDLYPQKRKLRSITLRTERTAKTLGIDLTKEDISKMLTRYSLKFTDAGDGSFNVECPSYRYDMETEIDLIEEVARLVGYGNMPATSVRLAQHESKRDNSYAERCQLNQLWIAAGLTETINYSFINPTWRQWLKPNGLKPPTIQNRVNADLSELRTSLLPGLFNTASHNLRQREESVTIFETGITFALKDDSGVSEKFMSAGVMTGGGEEAYGLDMPRDFFRMKGIVGKVVAKFTGNEVEFRRPKTPKKFLYTHRQLEIVSGGAVVGLLGQVHTLAREPFDIETDLFCFEISIDSLVQSLNESRKVTALPKFPGIRRDLALVVDEKEETGGLIETIMDTDAKRIRSCHIFDLYCGKQVPEGKKSLAFNLFFQDDGKTLTDGVGDEIIGAILKRVGEKHNAVLRA